MILDCFLKHQIFDEFSTALRHNRRAPREQLKRNDLTRTATLTLLVFTPPHRRAHGPHGPFGKGPFGGNGPSGPMGPFGGHSEAIPNGKLFRMTSYSEASPNVKSFLMDGLSEWKLDLE